MTEKMLYVLQLWYELLLAQQLQYSTVLIVMDMLQEPS